MARIRNPSTSSASSSRKRSRESASPVRSAKRGADFHVLKTQYPHLPCSFSREGSPSKSVHWGKGSRIISGPTTTDPERRSQSPTRSALRWPPHGDEEEEHGNRLDDRLEPGAELMEDLCLTDRTASPTLSTVKKNAYDPKKLPPGVGQVRVNPAFNTKLSRTLGEELSLPRKDAIDERICDGIDRLRELIAQLVTYFPSLSKKAGSHALSQLLIPDHKQLIRYIGSIALSGGNGAESWQELLEDKIARRAVVWGVVSRALKENVFDELYFGAWPELEKRLASMEREQVQQDGFYRQRKRAEEIAKAEARTSSASTLNLNAFKKAIISVALGLESLLLPLWCLGEKADQLTWNDNGMRKVLTDIVYCAGTTARLMRSTRDVIFYFPPTFTDEEFEPARMECLNLQDMIRTSPYDRQEVQGRDRPILRKGLDSQSQAIVRVVCFPGIQAYRQGGGDLAKKQFAAERNSIASDDAPPDIMAARRIAKRNGEEYTVAEGVRTRVIAKSVVLLQWGQQRLLTREAGTSLHMDAVKNARMGKYFANSEGRVELYKLFEERTGTTASPDKPPQRSPSFIARGLNYFFGNDDDEEDAEIDLSAAPFKELLRAREMEKIGMVRAMNSPRSRKRPRDPR